MNPDNMTAKEVMEIVMGFQKTQVLYTATTLGIFEELTQSMSPMSARVLACRLGLDPDATERLLNACSALSLLKKSYTSNRLAVYKNTACAEMFLASSGPASMKPLIVKVGDLYALYGQLKTGIKEGKRQLNSALGKGDQCFNKGNGFYCDDEKQIEFLQTMHMFSMGDSPSVLRAFDLSPYKTAIDLGGGTGAFGLSLALKYPTMEVTVSDLDHVVNSRRHFLTDDLPDNLHFESKDFFEESLTSADLYILSHVIHDWGDEALDVLLKKVYKAIIPGGALLVLEKVLNDDKDGPLMTLIFDLGMLVAAGGRERAANEYRQLLNGHGFDGVQIKRLPEARFRDAILAVKPVEVISLGQ